MLDGSGFYCFDLQGFSLLGYHLLKESCCNYDTTLKTMRKRITKDKEKQLEDKNLVNLFSGPLRLQLGIYTSSF